VRGVETATASSGASGPRSAATSGGSGLLAGPSQPERAGPHEDRTAWSRERKEEALRRTSRQLVAGRVLLTTTYQAFLSRSFSNAARCAALIL
jgi:hypothetical protein